MTFAIRGRSIVILVAYLVILEQVTECRIQMR